MEFLFFIIIVLGILIYMVIKKYLDYKEFLRIIEKADDIEDLIKLLKEEE